MRPIAGYLHAHTYSKGNAMHMKSCAEAVLALSAMVVIAACGEANTNDFRPEDNPLRRGSEGADDDELRELRSRGLPASIEEAEAAPTGLLLRVENAIAWPQGAKQVPTQCHFNVRLCGVKKEQVEEDGKTHTQETAVNCHPLRGTVNQNETEVFYVSAGEALRIVKDTNNGYQAELQYKLTCQVTPNWYPGGQPQIDSGLDQGKQILHVRVQEALPTGYGVDLRSEFKAR